MSETYSGYGWVYTDVSGNEQLLGLRNKKLEALIWTRNTILHKRRIARILEQAARILYDDSEPGSMTEFLPNKGR